MAKKHKLSVKEWQSKPTGKYADGGGLYITVRAEGPLWFSFRYTLLGRSSEMGLGTLTDISLAKAREWAESLRTKVKLGVDLVEENRNNVREERLIREKRRLEQLAEQATFKRVAEEFLEGKRQEFSNQKHAKQWVSTLETYAYPILADKPIKDITRHDVLSVLQPHWLTKNETMTRVRQRIECIIDYAIAKDYRDTSNPALWKSSLKPLLPSPSKVQRVKHHAALPYQEMQAFMTQLKSMDGGGSQALRLLIYTACRTSEVLKAEWSEFDISGGVWTIPGSRMKARVPHRVALSSAALDLLNSIDRSSIYVFPGAREGRPLSNTAMLQTLKRMGRHDLTCHGFRSTFRDWCADRTNFDPMLAEVALAHQQKSETVKAYLRSDMLSKRFELLECWSRYCDGAVGNVTLLPTG